jgi:hypothetical protein
MMKTKILPTILGSFFLIILGTFTSSDGIQGLHPAIQARVGDPLASTTSPDPLALLPLVFSEADRTSIPTPEITPTASPSPTQSQTHTPTPTNTPTATADLSGWCENASYLTDCAEEDNIFVPIFNPGITRFSITATHPTYEIGVDNCSPDFSGCPLTLERTADVCTTLLDDGTHVVQGCTVTGWWRPYAMEIVVGSATLDAHYLVLYRKIQDESSWPQFLVFYEDGNLRLIPHPPPGRGSVCFGSSVIIGPAVGLDTLRPYVDIQQIQVDPATIELDVTYRNGGTAHLQPSVNRNQAEVIVDAGYPTSAAKPLAVFRSMFVSIGNADVDHIESPDENFPILGDWETLSGPWWYFYRQVHSSHNTSAPDLLVQVLE